MIKHSTESTPQMGTGRHKCRRQLPVRHCGTVAHKAGPGEKLFARAAVWHHVIRLPGELTNCSYDYLHRRHQSFRASADLMAISLAPEPLMANWRGGPAESGILVHQCQVGRCRCDSHQQKRWSFSRSFSKVRTSGYGVHLVNGGEIIVHIALPSANYS